MADEKQADEGEERPAELNALGKVVENIRHDIEVEDVHQGKHEGAAGMGADTRERGAAQQEAEMTESKPLVGTGIMTSGMWKGFLFGSLVGGLIGAALFAPLSFFLLEDTSLWVRLLLFGACGALGGATAGALYFGGRVPELEGELVDADHRPSAGTTMRDPHTDARGN